MRVIRFIVSFYCACFFTQLHAQPAPQISIILDDLGVERVNGERALQLHSNITFAFLPQELFTQPLLKQANQLNREVILHMPMESVARIRRNKGVLRQDMPETLFKKILKQNLNAIPGLIGVNNHRGSLLTQDARAMTWLMQELKQRNLFFIDSKTTAQSVAASVAGAHQIPNLTRHVFLDNLQQHDYIRGQMQQLVKIAKQRGWAIGIGHPHPETIDIIAELIPQFNADNIRLVRVSQLIHKQFPGYALDLTKSDTSNNE